MGGGPSRIWCKQPDTKRMDNLKKDAKARLDQANTEVNRINAIVKNNEIVLDNIQKDIQMVEAMYNDIRSSVNNFSRTNLRDNVQRYLNQPVTDFIKSYDPSYISNNNTIYLKVTSFDYATNTSVSLDTTAFNYQKPPQSIYDLLDEDTTYEDIAYIPNFNPEDYFYEPEGGNLTAIETQFAKVILYTKSDMVIDEIQDYGTINWKSNFSFDPLSISELYFIEFIEIAPGIKVTISNNKTTASFSNTASATTFKKVVLDSSLKISTTELNTLSTKFEELQTKQLSPTQFSTETTILINQFFDKVPTTIKIESI